MKRLIDKDEALRLLDMMSSGYLNGTDKTPESSAIVNAMGCISNMQEESPEAELMTAREISDGMIPTVIWLEDRSGITVGVWVHDHYEFEDGSIDESPDEMEAFKKGMYGKKYRIWKTCEPTEKQRRTKWKS